MARAKEGQSVKRVEKKLGHVRLSLSLSAAVTRWLDTPKSGAATTGDNDG